MKIIVEIIDQYFDPIFIEGRIRKYIDFDEYEEYCFEIREDNKHKYYLIISNKSGNVCYVPPDFPQFYIDEFWSDALKWICKNVCELISYV